MSDFDMYAAYRGVLPADLANKTVAAFREAWVETGGARALLLAGSRPVVVEIVVTCEFVASMFNPDVARYAALRKAPLDAPIKYECACQQRRTATGYHRTVTVGRIIPDMDGNPAPDLSMKELLFVRAFAFGDREEVSVHRQMPSELRQNVPHFGQMAVLGAARTSLEGHA